MSACNVTTLLVICSQELVPQPFSYQRLTTNFPKFNPRFNLMIINFGFVVNVKSFLMRVLGGTNINFLVWLLDGIRPRLIECRLIWSRLPNFPDQWPGPRVTQVHGQCNIVSGLITTPSSNIVTQNQSGPHSLHNTCNLAGQWWWKLLHFTCWKDKSRYSLRLRHLYLHL